MRGRRNLRVMTDFWVNMAAWPPVFIPPLFGNPANITAKSLEKCHVPKTGIGDKKGGENSADDRKGRQGKGKSAPRMTGPSPAWPVWLPERKSPYAITRQGAEGTAWPPVTGQEMWHLEDPWQKSYLARKASNLKRQLTAFLTSPAGGYELSTHAWEPCSEVGTGSQRSEDNWRKAPKWKWEIKLKMSGMAVKGTRGNREQKNIIKCNQILRDLK